LFGLTGCQQHDYKAEADNSQNSHQTQDICAQLEKMISDNHPYRPAPVFRRVECYSSSLTMRKILGRGGYGHKVHLHPIPKLVKLNLLV
jgi:hypothetical protein